MSRWDEHLLVAASADEPLPVQLDRLFAQQRATWDLFRNGEAALAQVKTKRFSRDGGDCIVQSNPGRATSTNAKVDPASIAKRPCFLCPTALPPQERGIAFGRYVVMPNPFPILKNHVTVALDEHLPQTIDGRVDDFLALAEALGPDMFVLYNGPRCGASAPDHMHFQACSARDIPVFSRFQTSGKHDRFIPLSLWGRNLLSGSFSGAGAAAGALRRAISVLSARTEGNVEPMFNIIAHRSGSRLHVAFFPRAKHRSACYFAAPEKRLSISPAAVEMAGIVVVADPAHFDRTDEAAVIAMYREVTLDDAAFFRFAKELQ